MKKILPFLMAALIWASCNKQHKPQTTNTNQTEVRDTTTVMPEYNGEKATTTLADYDYTAPYICPNHCPGSGSNKPGECPVCGMELIPNPDYEK